MSEPPSPTSPSAAAASAGDVLERRKTEVIRKLAAHVPSDDGDPIRLKKLGIIEKVLASFEDPNMNSDYLDEINNFHSYRYQPMTSTLAYLDNIEQRLQLLKDIKTTKLKYTDPEVPPKALPAELITHVVWAAFMAAPIDALQTLLNNMQSGRVGYHALTDALGQVETNLPILIHINLTGQLPSRTQTSQSSQSSSRQAALLSTSDSPKTPPNKRTGRSSPLSPTASEKKARNATNRKTALERDKERCVLLGTTDPHVAHIFSHAAISHVSMYRSKLNCLATIWGDARINRYQEAHGESLDVPQNMLSLNYTVHHRWDKAQVAFEPIGQVNNSTIRVRLHLLEDTKLRSLKRKRDSSRDEFQWRNDLAQDPRETLKPFKDQFSSPSPLELRLVSSVTQHIVRDGHIFDIKARNPAHLPSYELLDLQYRICLMATLLGGGETSDEYLSESDADNEGQARLSDSKKILVDQWFQRMETDPVDLATAVIERLEEEKAIEEAWGEPS